MRVRLGLRAIRLCVGIVGLAVTAQPGYAGPNEDLALVKQRLREELWRQAPAPNLPKILAELSPQGTWPDVDYDSKQRGGWRSFLHLSRLQALVVAYTAPDNPLHGNAELKAGIVRALDYWLTENLRRPQWAPNWWYNDIAVPLALGDIGVLLEGQLPAALHEKLLARLRLAKAAGTGQNWVWQSGAVLRYALVTDNRELAAKMFGNIFGEIRTGTSEGLQPDYSFHQHGPQPQLGNYGLAFVRDQIEYLALATGTAFAPSSQQRQLLRDYLLQGQAWLVWHDQYDLNNSGRQLSSVQSKYAGLAKVLARLAVLEPEQAAAYRAVLAGGVPLGLRIFPRSDMLIWRTPGWMLSLRATSARTIPNEQVNSENEQGAYLGLGSVFLYRSGLEYKDLPRVWDWRRIPGTLAPLAGGSLHPTNARVSTASFVGGVSDGEYGAFAMDMQPAPRDKKLVLVPAHQAWFCLGSAWVALTRVLPGTLPGPVAVTVSQALLDGPVTVQDAAGHAAPAAAGEQRYAGARAVTHAGWRYTFPPSQQVVVRSGPREGSWFASYPKPEEPSYREKVTHDVFCLYVELGDGVAKPDAAVIVSPADSPATLPQILANSADLQAVRDKDLAQAAFYTAGQVELLPGVTVAAADPCLVQLRRLAAGYRLSVTDPTQKLRSLRLTLAGGPFPAEQLSLELPQGGLAGSSVSREFPAP